MGVEILGEKVVLFRDAQGAIQCLHDVCPHRGAPLHRVRPPRPSPLHACLCLRLTVLLPKQQCRHFHTHMLWAQKSDGMAASACARHAFMGVTIALQGWVAEVEGHDCVVCPYHGWAFDGEGVLQDVPAAEHQKEWPRKQLVQSYPVKEKVRPLWPARTLQ